MRFELKILTRKYCLGHLKLVVANNFENVGKNHIYHFCFETQVREKPCHLSIKILSFVVKILKYSKEIEILGSQKPTKMI